MNTDADVRPFRPMLSSLRIDGIRLRLEISRFDEAQLALPFARDLLHRNVPPGRVRQLAMHLVRVNDFLPQHFAAPERGAQKTAPSLGQRPERKAHTVTDEPKQVFAG